MPVELNTVSFYIDYTVFIVLFSNFVIQHCYIVYCVHIMFTGLFSGLVIPALLCFSPTLPNFFSLCTLYCSYYKLYSCNLP